MKLKDIFTIITSPTHWFRLGRTSKELSYRLNNLMDAGAEVEIYSYRAKLGSVNLWVSNYPYAYGSLLRDSPFSALEEDIPDRITVIRLRNYISKKIIEKAFE